LEHVPDNHPREFKVIDNENLDLSLGGAVVFFRLQLFTFSQEENFRRMGWGYASQSPTAWVARQIMMPPLDETRRSFVEPLPYLVEYFLPWHSLHRPGFHFSQPSLRYDRPFLVDF
jgi:hypothetical protein